MTSRRHVAVAVYDSVTRIADGIGPDDQDRADLGYAAATMRGEYLLLVWIQGNGVGPAPNGQTLDNETWFELVSETVRQLGMKEILGNDPILYLSNLSETLETIAKGDRALAKQFDAFSSRISTLAEMHAPAL